MAVKSVHQDNQNKEKYDMKNTLQKLTRDTTGHHGYQSEDQKKIEVKQNIQNNMKVRLQKRELKAKEMEQ